MAHVISVETRASVALRLTLVNRPSAAKKMTAICIQAMPLRHAQDAAQDVFVKLFLQRAKFRGEAKYSTWVHGIAVRTCLMQRRSTFF